MWPWLLVTLELHCSAASWWKSHVCPLLRVMASVFSQQARSISFILIEGIYSWAPESVKHMHAHCSGHFCSDCGCWEWCDSWHCKFHHTGLSVEVTGCNLPIFPKKEPDNLLLVCSPTCMWCLVKWIWLKVCRLCANRDKHYHLKQIIVTVMTPWPQCSTVAAVDCTGSLHEIVSESM